MFFFISETSFKCNLFIYDILSHKSLRIQWICLNRLFTIWFLLLIGKWQMGSTPRWSVTVMMHPAGYYANLGKAKFNIITAISKHFTILFETCRGDVTLAIATDRRLANILKIFAKCLISIQSEWCSSNKQYSNGKWCFFHNKC